MATMTTLDINGKRVDVDVPADLVQDATAHGVALPVAMQTGPCFDEAARAGFGNIDGTQYPTWWIGHAAGTQQERLQRTSTPPR